MKGAKPKRTKKRVPADPGPPWKMGPFQPPDIHINQPTYVPIDTDDWTQDKYVEQYLDDNI